MGIERMKTDTQKSLQMGICVYLVQLWYILFVYLYLFFKYFCFNSFEVKLLKLTLLLFRKKKPVVIRFKNKIFQFIRFIDVSSV